MISILFICTGNICRSPSADGVMRYLAKRRGLEIRVDSCGTHDYHIGEPPDERSIETARKNGVDIAPLRARMFDPSDYENFDYLVAMDNGHMDILRTHCPPGYEHKLVLFLDYLEGYEGQCVPDPYYGGASDFDHVYDLCYRGCEAMLKAIA